MLAIKHICTDGGTQSRAQLDWLALDEYARAMRAGDTFPPIIVFYDQAIYWLADGFHRLVAAQMAGLVEIDADVRQGTKRDAILYSVGANHDHGVRRTNRDKDTAVKLLLRDDEWMHKSDRWIGEKCGVDHTFVGRIRTEIEDTTGVKHQLPREGKDGKKRRKPRRKPSLPETNGATQAPLPVTESPKASEPETRSEPEVIPAAMKPIKILNLDACYLADYVIDPIHLVVTSPPYNVEIEYNHHHDALSTHLDLLHTVWRECYKVMVDGGRIAVVVPFGVGRNPWTPFASQVMDSLMQSGFTLRGQIVWDKGTAGGRTSWGSFRMSSNPALRDTTEAILIAHKGSPTLPLPDCIKGHDDKGTFTPPLADGEYFMALAQDHWQIAPESATRVKHPAPFPVELVKRLIDFYAYPGAHVLDPFGGSGTTAIAARQCGCQATLIEIDATYCKLAEERLNHEHN